LKKITAQNTVARGALCAFAFVVVFLILVVVSIIRDEGNYRLVSAFLTYPMSWAIFSIFHPVLEWLGPVGSASRVIGEWVLLGFSGIAQYLLIGILIVFLSDSSRHPDEK
jgi:hypothetical protein